MYVPHPVGPPGSRFLAPRPGDEIDLSLDQELERELSPDPAAVRVQELRASGGDRLRVRVVKAPLADVLSADDAVKVVAPELIGDAGDSGVYVRVGFLDLPTAPADSAARDVVGGLHSDAVDTECLESLRVVCPTFDARDDVVAARM